MKHALIIAVLALSGCQFKLQDAVDPVSADLLCGPLRGAFGAAVGSTNVEIRQACKLAKVVGG